MGKSTEHGQYAAQLSQQPENPASTKELKVQEEKKRPLPPQYLAFLWLYTTPDFGAVPKHGTGEEVQNQQVPFLAPAWSFSHSTQSSEEMCKLLSYARESQAYETLHLTSVVFTPILQMETGGTERLGYAAGRRSNLNLKVGCQTLCRDEHSPSATLRTICSKNSTAPRSSLKLLAWELFQSPLYEILTLFRRLGHSMFPLPSCSIPYYPQTHLCSLRSCATPPCALSGRLFPQAPVQPVASKPGISAHMLIALKGQPPLSAPLNPLPKGRTYHAVLISVKLPSS